MNVSSQLIFVFLSYKSLPALLLDCSAGVVSLSSGLLFRLFLLLMGRPQACALLVEILLSTPIHIPLGASRQAQTSSILGSPSLSHMLAFIFLQLGADCIQHPFFQAPIGSFSRWAFFRFNTATTSFVRIARSRCSQHLGYSPFFLLRIMKQFDT